MLLRSPTPRPEAIRARGVEILQPLVTQAVAFRRLAHDAHVNVRGPCFEPLHALFGAAYDQAHAHVDVLKERIRKLGGTPVDGELQPEVSIPPDGMALCEALATSLSAHIEAVDAAFYETADLRLTADNAVLQSAMVDLEHLCWRLLSHLP